MANELELLLPFTICTSCKETIQNPLLLPCLDSCCSKCFEQNVRTVEGRYVVYCKLCERDIPVEEPNDLRINFFANNTKDLLMICHQNQDILCSSCGDSQDLQEFSQEQSSGKAEVRCTDCGEFLCHACLKAHKRVKLTREHKLLTLDEVKPMNLYKMIHSSVTCSKHPREKLISQYCETCIEPLCVTCIIDHPVAHHQLRNFNDGGSFAACMFKVRSKTDSSKKKVRSLEGYRNNVEKTVDNLNELANTIRLKIKNSVCMLVEALHQRETRLLSELDHIIVTKMEGLESYKSLLNQNISGIQRVNKFVDTALDQGDYVEKLSVLKVVDSRINELLNEVKVIAHSTMEDNAFMEFNGIGSAAMLKMIEHLGQLKTVQDPSRTPDRVTSTCTITQDPVPAYHPSEPPDNIFSPSQCTSLNESQPSLASDSSALENLLTKTLGTRNTSTPCDGEVSESGANTGEDASVGDDRDGNGFVQVGDDVVASDSSALENLLTDNLGTRNTSAPCDSESGANTGEDASVGDDRYGNGLDDVTDDDSLPHSPSVLEQVTGSSRMQTASSLNELHSSCRLRESDNDFVDHDVFNDDVLASYDGNDRATYDKASGNSNVVSKDDDDGHNGESGSEGISDQSPKSSFSSTKAGGPSSDNACSRVFEDFGDFIDDNEADKRNNDEDSIVTAGNCKERDTTDEYPTCTSMLETLRSRIMPCIPSTSFIVGRETTLSFTDPCNSNEAVNFGSIIVGKLKCPDGSIQDAQVTCDCKVSFTATAAGNHELSFTVNNKHIVGSPIPFWVGSRKRRLSNVKEESSNAEEVVELNNEKGAENDETRDWDEHDHEGDDEEDEVSPVQRKRPRVQRFVSDEDETSSSDIYSDSDLSRADLSHSANRNSDTGGVTCKPSCSTPSGSVSYIQTLCSHIHIIGTAKGRSRGQFNDPFDVAIDRSGNLVVVDMTNHRVQVLNNDGNCLLVFGKRGSRRGMLKNPTGVAVNCEGKILVSDSDNHRIQIFSEEGELCQVIGSQGRGRGKLSCPVGLAVIHNDRFIVADKDNHRLQVFSLDGRCIKVIGERGKADALFEFPRFIAVNKKSGRVYVSDSGNHRIQVFDEDGNFLFKFGSEGSADGKFNAPTGVAVNSQGQVIVADYHNKRVQVFTCEGNFLAKVKNPSKRKSKGCFHSPEGLAVNSRDQIFVSDCKNHRVQVISPFW